MAAFQFLKYMDDESLTRYEAFLKITKDPNKTLSERKAYISALLIGSGKISANKKKYLPIFLWTFFLTILWRVRFIWEGLCIRQISLN